MKAKQLPKYPLIDLNEIPPASTILYYGGVKLTEWFGNHVYKHQYKPPAYHAAFYLESGVLLNVGKFKTLQRVTEDFRSNRRLDVIMYGGISDVQRKELVVNAMIDADDPKLGLNLPTYDILGFLGFGIRRIFKKVPKFLSQSVRKEFCSESVVEEFGKYNIKVSDKEASLTAPWDLFEYALKNPVQCEMRTLWVGKDFKL